MTPQNTPASEQELDDIMEDLIVGHNWEYARKALLAWRDREIEKVLKDISKDPVGVAVWTQYIGEGTAGGFTDAPKVIPLGRINNYIAAHQAQKGKQ